MPHKGSQDSSKTDEEHAAIIASLEEKAGISAVSVEDVKIIVRGCGSLHWNTVVQCKPKIRKNLLKLGKLYQILLNYIR